MRSSCSGESILHRPDSSMNMVRQRAWAGVVTIFFFQAEDGIRDLTVTGVQTCALPIFLKQEIPVVLAGDYNVAPTEIDIYPTKSWDKDAMIQPKSRAAFKSLVAQGWLDAIRELHPEKPMFTFWDYKRNRWPRDAGLRLDHLLLSPALAPRLLKAGVDQKIRGEESASDHAPAWVVLK